MQLKWSQAAPHQKMNTDRITLQYVVGRMEFIVWYTVAPFSLDEVKKHTQALPGYYQPQRVTWTNPHRPYVKFLDFLFSVSPLPQSLSHALICKTHNYDSYHELFSQTVCHILNDFTIIYILANMHRVFFMSTNTPGRKGGRGIVEKYVILPKRLVCECCRTDTMWHLPAILWNFLRFRASGIDWEYGIL